VADAIETRYTPHMYYHTKFRLSRSNCLGAGMGLQNRGSWGPAPWDNDVSE